MDELERKLKLTIAEFGENALSLACLITDDYPRPYCMGLSVITCPTIGRSTLGHVDYKVARFFEDC